MNASWLTDASTDAPMIFRVMVGLVGALVLVAGARWYHRTLALSAFAVGAVGAGFAAHKMVILVHLVGQQTLVVGLSSVIGGLTMAGLARFAHKLALGGLGALIGLTLSAAAIAQVGAPPVLMIVGALIGGLLFPWVYDQLLKVLTPVVGAVLIAWAVGRPEQLALLVGLWVLGVLLQIRGPNKPKRDDDEDG